MRCVVALLMVVLLAAPAVARKKKHERAAAPKVRVVVNDLHARESAAAEAQLAELRGATELSVPASEVPVSRNWVPQETDGEVPAGLKSSKKK
jgi:hypothetical protein